MEEHDEARAVKLGELRKEIMEGLESGGPVPWNPRWMGRENRQKAPGRNTGGLPPIAQFTRVLDDLAEIRGSLSRSGRDKEDRFIDLLDRKIHALAREPYVGRSREELAEGLRSLPVSRYVVLYRLRKGIEIVRLLPGAHDLDFVVAEETIEVGDLLRIDPYKYEVTVEGSDIGLTATEFRILQLLASKKGFVFPRHKILSHLWGSDEMVHDRTIDVHIMHLREKMGKAAPLLKSLRGFGYKFEA
jgi:DNA-binding response OmpR family regulator